MRSSLTQFLFSPKVPVAVLLPFVIFTIGFTGYTMFGKKTKENIFSNSVPPLNTEVVSRVVSMRVEKVRQDPIGAGPLTPRKGYVFIIPTITFTNNSTTSYELIPLLALHIKDSKGNVYNVTAIPSDTNELSGPILPYDKVREEVGFEVASEATDLILYFETGTPERTVLTERLYADASWW